MDLNIIKKINEIIDINSRLNLIMEKIAKNSFTEYEIKDINNSIYIKPYHSKKNEFNYDKNCCVCYNINLDYLQCKHNLCYECYHKWDKICVFNNKVTDCPICKVIIT